MTMHKTVERSSQATIHMIHYGVDNNGRSSPSLTLSGIILDDYHQYDLLVTIKGRHSLGGDALIFADFGAIVNIDHTLVKGKHISLKGWLAYEGSCDPMASTCDQLCGVSGRFHCER